MALAMVPGLLYSHSVGQIQTTKFLAPETVQFLSDRAGSGSAGFRAGDTLSYIIQFTPVANGANLGVAGYVTEYLPPGVEVVGASIVAPDGSGGFVNVTPNLPGTIDGGWGNKGGNTFLAPFNTSAYDSTGLCAANNRTNNCEASMAELHADTGIFFSTDTRTAAFPVLPATIEQGTNGYNIKPTAAGQLNPIIGQAQATTHNLWDASQTNAFGSKQGDINGIAAPKSSAPALMDGRGPTPFGAGSVVAGPLTGYPLDNTGNVGPWQRIAYPGSRSGTRSTGPACSANATRTSTAAVCPAGSDMAIGGAPTSAGFNLSPFNPLPASTNAMRFAIGQLTVGQLAFVKVSIRLLSAPPAAGLINQAEVFGGDAAGADNGQDNVWRYHVPSVALNNSNLFIRKTIVCVYSGANCVNTEGAVVPPNAKIRYRLTYLNTGTNAQTNIVLSDTLPTQTQANSVSNVVVVSGKNILPFTPAAPAGGGATITFQNYSTAAPAGHLLPGEGGAIELDVQTNAGNGNVVKNLARLVSSEIPNPGVISVANSNVANVASLSISKSVANGSAQPGGTVSYTITVTNSGSADTKAGQLLTVYDFLPTSGGATENVATRFSYGGTSTPAVSAVNIPPTQLPYSSQANREQLSWSFGGLAAGASLSITFTANVGNSVPLSTTPYTNDVRVAYHNQSDPAEASAVAQAPVYIGARISGRVFEDINYGGGGGRSYATSSGIGRPNARVELYNSSGGFVASTTTDSSGNYEFGGLGAGSYSVRVVSLSITSSRLGGVSCLNCLAVQTFRTDASGGSAVADPNRVGGENPARIDAGANTTNANISTLSTGTTTAQSIAPVTISGANVAGMDFGFNFDTIVNTRDSGQGSVRQFLVNSNALGGETLLAQAGSRINPVSGASIVLPAGRETSVFMIPDGLSHPGQRSGLLNQLTGGVAIVTPLTTLPAITGVYSSLTVIDGGTQSFNVGNTNAGTLGAGGTVGTDATALASVQRPEVQIQDTAGLALGIDIQQSNIIVRGLSIYGFGNAADSDNDADIRIGNNFTGTLIEGNVIGAAATGFADPGAGPRSGGDLVRSAGADNGILQNNLIGFSAGSGVALANTSNGWQILFNEIRGNNLVGGSAGLAIIGNSATTTVQGNLVASNRRAGIDTTGGGSGATLVNNTVIGNGVGGVVTAGIRFGSNGNTADRNIVSANFGAGIMATSATGTNLFTRNSISANGTIGTPSNQIGIDLLAAGDNAGTGTAPYVTLNDSGDGDVGANGLLNYPIIESVSLSGTNVVFSGFARPGSIIEFFVASPDPSGFGEGQTYLVTRTEGSVSDTDTGTGTYGPGAVGGILQGTDTTSRYSFSVPRASMPSVTAATQFTATATLANSTSEFSGLKGFDLPSISVLKAAQVHSDPINNQTNPRRIPGGFVTYTIVVTNSGRGQADLDSIVTSDPIPPDTKLFVGNLGGANSGPVGFTDGSPSSGLTYTYTSLGSGTDDLSFSNDGGTTFAYTPTPDASGVDAAVTHVRINPKGTFAGDAVAGPPSPNFQVQFRVQIK